MRQFDLKVESLCPLLLQRQRTLQGTVRNPLELSQKPLMRLLGSRDKRHYVFDGGHVPPRQQEVVR